MRYLDLLAYEHDRRAKSEFFGQDLNRYESRRGEHCVAPVRLADKVG